MHINALELKAILLVLQVFTPLLQGKHIKVYCDNTTAISYVNEVGGTKSFPCNEFAINIWDWCLKSNAWIICSHIPGSANTLTDKASRLVNDRHEWQLNVTIFHQFCTFLEHLLLTWFASRINMQITLLLFLDTRSGGYTLGCAFFKLVMLQVIIPIFHHFH